MPEYTGKMDVVAYLRAHGPSRQAMTGVEKKDLEKARSFIIDSDADARRRWEMAMGSGTAASRYKQAKTKMPRWVEHQPRLKALEPEAMEWFGVPGFIQRYERQDGSALTRGPKYYVAGHRFEAARAAPYWAAHYCVCRRAYDMAVLPSMKVANAAVKDWLCRRVGVVGGNVEYRFSNES